MDPHGEPAHERGLIARALTAVEAGLARADSAFAARRLEQMAQRLDLAQKTIASQARRIRDLEARTQLRLVTDPQADTHSGQGGRPAQIRSRPNLAWMTAGAWLCVGFIASAVAIFHLFGAGPDNQILGQPDTAISGPINPTRLGEPPQPTTYHPSPTTRTPPVTPRIIHTRQPPTASYLPTPRVHPTTRPPSREATGQPAPTTSSGATQPPRAADTTAPPTPHQPAPATPSVMVQCAGMDVNLTPLARACLLG